MNNMDIYNRYRQVPQEAQKAISGGRLRGMTDINPMWRINVLTEMFGPCGIGWKYIITRKEMIPSETGEISCFVDLDLFYRLDGKWSEAVAGTGGAAYVAKEKGSLYVNDECYKMALTDALSVACKALGIGADVYWSAGTTKYQNDTKAKEQSEQTKDESNIDRNENEKPGYRNPPEDDPIIKCERCEARFPDYYDGKTLIKAAALAKRSAAKYGLITCGACVKASEAEK